MKDYKPTPPAPRKEKPKLRLPQDADSKSPENIKWRKSHQKMLNIQRQQEA